MLPLPPPRRRGGAHSASAPRRRQRMELRAARPRRAARTAARRTVRRAVRSSRCASAAGSGRRCAPRRVVGAAGASRSPHRTGLRCSRSSARGVSARPRDRRLPWRRNGPTPSLSVACAARRVPPPTAVSVASPPSTPNPCAQSAWHTPSPSRPGPDSPLACPRVLLRPTAHRRATPQVWRRAPRAPHRACAATNAPLPLPSFAVRAR
mmetsp:Transcript_29607/g.74466  ORF Transcript_29607/g.74466 Transcript_29607/m.74466 type:complete len:208 (+) Transcript_29607:496-1119(+)